MSSIMVLKHLKELFPQVDNRILKAASIEHANNLDAAVEFILLDVVPNLPTKSSQNEKLVRSNSRASSVRSESSNGEDETQELYNSIVNSAPPKRTINNSSSNNSSVISQSSNSTTESRNWDLGVLIANNKLANHQNRANNSNRSNGSNQISSSQSESIQKGKIQQNGSNQFPSFESEMRNKGKNQQNRLNIFPSFESEMNQNRDNEPNGSNGLNHFPSIESEMNQNRENEPNKSSNFPSDVVTRSSCSVNAEFLEDFVNDAKNNKLDLMVSVETLTNMLREVVQLEEKAKFVKDESSLAGQETLKKVQELKEMLVRAKEANEMHSGEVYGERSILSTEAKEFQSRLLTLSEEKSKSLEIIEEIRVVLEARLEAAEEEISRAEKEKIEKENSAKDALKEQEELMNAIVEESKKLKQEAEENSKLREFLVDRGRIVDTLQGEISVICEDITKLKEIIHGNIPMTKSIFSTMSSLSTSVSASSSSERETLKNSTSSSEKNNEMEREREITNGGERENLSGSSEDWELFEKEEVEN